MKCPRIDGLILCDTHDGLNKLVKWSVRDIKSSVCSGWGLGGGGGESVATPPTPLLAATARSVHDKSTSCTRHVYARTGLARDRVACTCAPVT